ncbi:MAG TPA: hypothetical protein VMM77_12300, partial [Gemmatimonadaceae bacterium]|nr:hypothetical protein [Gemmatimonadaceae bacterium]
MSPPQSGQVRGKTSVAAGEEACPAGAGGGALRGVRQVGDVGLGRAGLGRQVVARAADSRAARRLAVVAAEIDDPFAQPCVGCEDAVVAVAVNAGRRDQAAQRGEKLEGREGEDSAAVADGSRRGGGAALLARLGVALDAQAFEGERRPGAVPQQPFPAGGVGAVDADGGVQAEAATGLPGEHVLYGVLVEESAALEEAEHALQQRALEAKDVVGKEVGRLVEDDAGVVALGEDAVQDDDMEVEVGVEGGAEAVEEGDGAEPG